jgi:hypothetical protein
MSPTLSSSLAVPAAIANAGDHAARRFLEFFAATIRNKDTRLAYYRAACHFFGWLAGDGRQTDCQTAPGCCPHVV